MTSQERWCVVTGGRGFAARHLVEMLIRYEMFCVRIADLGPSIKLDAYEEEGTLGKALSSGRAQYVSADLRDKGQVLKVCHGADVVFHMAAPDSSINNYNLHHSVNVEATKAEGEALVLKANGEKGLLTCSLRPSGIFGPGDKLLVPSLVDAARAGKSKFIIGDGNNMYDFTYVENVAHAHICAERALASKGTVAEKASGQLEFPSGIEFNRLTRLILCFLRPRIKIPAFIMMPIAHLVELIYKLLAPYGMKVPQLTPSRIRLLSCNRTFNSSKAKDRLGYTPIVSLQEGLERTIESYSHLRAEHQPKRDGPSKVHRYLGGGRVADVLLWKDKRQSLATLLIFLAFYYNFVASGYTIVTTVFKLILLASVFLYIHANLPERMYD
uniref:Reticulon-like protein n=1 Tax=Chenopodium quinoa TaxID=63459 RepID=A0A803M2E2_CHEQI